MTKKERIAQLEKELEKLKQRVAELETMRVIGIGDIPNIPWQPSPDPWISKQHPWIYPTIKWDETYSCETEPLFGKVAMT